MREIVAALRDDAELTYGNGTRYRRKFGSLTLRCDDDRDSILAMAKRLEKKRTFMTRNTCLPAHSQTRRYSRDAYDQFVIDGEIDNAINYNNLFDVPTIFSQSKDLIINMSHVCDGFVCGRTVDSCGSVSRWYVFHIDTGLTCGPRAGSRAGATANFKQIEKERLDRAIEKNASLRGFQNECIKSFY